MCVGVKKVRFTGGEPTLRKGLVEIVKEVGKRGNVEMGMTTNGLTLHR